MDTSARVETDGTRSLPYVGRIRAAGLSEDELAHAIEKRLAARQLSPTRTCWLRSQISARRRACKAGSARLEFIPSTAQRIDPAVIAGRRSEGRERRRNDHRAAGRRLDPQLRRQGRGGESRPGARCQSPTTMRYLSTWRHSSIYTGMLGIRANSLRLARSRCRKPFRSAEDWPRSVRNGGSGSSARPPTASTWKSRLRSTTRCRGDIIVVNERIF